MLPGEGFEGVVMAKHNVARFKDGYQTSVGVEWLRGGWFAVRLRYDPLLVGRIKEFPQHQRLFNGGTKKWEMAPEIYEQFRVSLDAFWKVEIPPAPAAAQVKKLPPLPKVYCDRCGREMSVARASTTCGGLRPCAPVEVGGPAAAG
jgi:hypothetical protein